ncbi:MAG: energy transducer TonB [Pseudomonadota bacterium]
MHAGQYISGAGHLALIGWVLFGGVFRSEPPAFEMTEVSVITGAEFDAILAAQRPPDQVTEVAQPQAPVPTPDAPEVAATADAPITQPDPVETQVPPQDTAPEVVPDDPPPPAEVTDAAPTLEDPGDIAEITPELAPEAAPRPVERVAPEPVAQPEPEATPDLDEQQALAPDEAGEETQEAQEATAPEEATTEIVTEATAAPARSARPPGRRPSAPARQAQEPDTDSQADAIAAAVAAAQVDTPTPAAPSGPPLTQGERETLRLAIKACWNVGSMSSEALRTIVVVGLDMNRDGTPIGSTIRLLSHSGGSAGAARQGFETARRAILRCGARGFELPDEKYSQWQSIEITFDPRKMQ